MIIDTPGLDPLVADMESAADQLRKEVGQVVAKGGLNIKQEIKNDFRQSDSFGSTKPGGVIQNVRYNRRDTVNSAEAEIAPFIEDDGTGGLTGVAIYGGSRGGGGTVADPIIALQAEGPRFTAALEALAGMVLDE
ncbi:hypothetical protein [Arthrobacter sp. UYCu712]|uniref:hypothetical protein n=1 Tax=Arthrobacter sp. UYCu712 TaxID=3156340 RepID=UPI003393FD71